MKQFVAYSIRLAISIIVIALLLDITYTAVYEKFPPRNKVSKLIGINSVTYDAVFLGSSRVENHIKTSVFQKEGINALNLGIQGGTLQDNYLFLKLLVKNNNEIKKLFVQVDYLYNSEKGTNLIQSYFLPYIKDDHFYTYFQEKETANLNKHRYVPFFRYATNDFKIGFREFFSTAMTIKNKNLDEGFIPKYGNNSLKSYSLPNTIKTSNSVLNKIEALCAKEGIKIVYFCAPFCSKLENKEFLNKLSNKIAPFYDYSSSFEDELFWNCSHLNEKGAEVFTQLLLKNHFKSSAIK